MKRNMSLKMVVILFVLFTLCPFFEFSAKADTTIYAGASVHKYTMQKACPPFELESSFASNLQAETANALRQWFLFEYAYRIDWYDILWNHSEQILLEPYIIKTEYTDAYELTVYCSSGISTYALLEDTTGEQYLAQGLDAAGLFRVTFDTSIQDDLYALSVHCVTGNDEELFVGAGIGTDGFPGLSDQLAHEIPDWGLDTSCIAEEYLKTNQIDAKVVTW